VLGRGGFGTVELVELSQQRLELDTARRSRNNSVVLRASVSSTKSRVSVLSTKSTLVSGKKTYVTDGEDPFMENSNFKYALKSMALSSMDHTALELLKREKDILATLDHPFIVKFVKSFHDASYIYLLMESVDGGELLDAMVAMEVLSSYAVKFYVGSIIQIFDYVHEMNIVYRDLKPENIMLDTTGYLKLIDFGLAKQLSAGPTYTVVGTPAFMAPEILLGHGYGPPGDIWAIGVCLYEFLCGYLPFGDDSTDISEICYDILNSQVTMPDFLKAEEDDLLSRMLRKVPQERLGVSLRRYDEIRRHVFFDDFDWTALTGRTLEAPYKPVARIDPDQLEKAELNAPPNFDVDASWLAQF
jgi:cGMP-dependent protein kinase